MDMHCILDLIQCKLIANMSKLPLTKLLLTYKVNNHEKILCIYSTLEFILPASWISVGQLLSLLIPPEFLWPTSCIVDNWF